MAFGRGMGGAVPGAMAGAEIGSIVPGIGTGIGAAIGGGLGLLNGFMSDDPSDSWEKAQEAQQRRYQEAQRYLAPLWQHGMDQYGNLSTAENALMNPIDLENKWASSYETSPYAKQMLEANKTSGLDAASSMGLLGSSAALNNIQKGAGNIVNADRRNFLNDLMQKYMKGIGIGQDIYGIGANAGGQMAHLAGDQGLTEASLTYGKENANRNSMNDMLKSIIAFGGNGGFNVIGGGNDIMPAYAQNAILNG